MEVITFNSVGTRVEETSTGMDNTNTTTSNDIHDRIIMNSAPLLVGGVVDRTNLRLTTTIVTIDARGKIGTVAMMDTATNTTLQEEDTGGTEEVGGVDEVTMTTTV